MQRIHAIDAFRGACIVGMVLMHVENRASQVVGNMFGGTTVAEGFVFISGLVAVLTLSRKPRELHGTLARKRALRIYLYHLATLFVVIALFHGLYSFGPYWEWYWPDTGMMWNEPLKAGALASVFLYQPYLLDILPMFVIFSLLMPIIYHFASRRHIGFLCFSLALWALAQIGLYADITLFEPPLYLGYFNLIAWQILFVLGAYAGVYFLIENNPVPKRNGLTILALSTFIVLITLCTLYRIDHIQTAVDLSSLYHFAYFVHSDKTYLGWLRMINLIVLAYLIPWAILACRHHAHKRPVILLLRWLAFIGRYSLQVFAFHIPLIYCYSWARFYIAGFIIDETLFFLFDMLATLGIVIFLTLPAYLSHYWASRRKAAR